MPDNGDKPDIFTNVAHTRQVAPTTANRFAKPHEVKNAKQDGERSTKVKVWPSLVTLQKTCVVWVRGRRTRRCAKNKKYPVKCTDLSSPLRGKLALANPWLKLACRHYVLYTACAKTWCVAILSPTCSGLHDVTDVELLHNQYRPV